MKKIVCFVLIFLLIFSMSTTVFAADIEENNGTATGEVKASYVAGEPGGTVISVDIAWNGLEFTYNGESHKVWNPETHSYEGEETAAGWATSNGSITITNHSNSFLEATFSYSQETGYEDTSVVFTPNFQTGYDSNRVYIGNADNGLGENGAGQAQSLTVEVVPTGFIPSTTPDGDTIGQITVSISTFSHAEDGLASLIATLESGCTIAAMKPGNASDVEYGAHYIDFTKLNLAKAAVQEADEREQNTNGTYTEHQQIQAVNDAIIAFYASIKIKK